MPTSITDRARLQPVAFAPFPRRPTAANNRSARLCHAFLQIFRVRLCATVTVQFSPSSNCASGLPTMNRAPDHHRIHCHSSRPMRSSSPASRYPPACTAPDRAEPSREPPGMLTGWLSRRHPCPDRPQFEHQPVRVDLFRKRQLHQDAVQRWCHPYSAVRTSASRSACRGVRRQLDARNDFIPGFGDGRLRLSRLHIDRARRVFEPTSTTASPGLRPAPATKAGTASAIRPRSPAANALPSMTAASLKDHRSCKDRYRDQRAASG
jgi:hypothetical protein